MSYYELDDSLDGVKQKRFVWSLPKAMECTLILEWAQALCATTHRRSTRLLYLSGSVTSSRRVFSVFCVFFSQLFWVFPGSETRVRASSFFHEDRRYYFYMVCSTTFCTKHQKVGHRRRSNRVRPCCLEAVRKHTVHLYP